MALQPMSFQQTKWQKTVIDHAAIAVQSERGVIYYGVVGDRNVGGSGTAGFGVRTAKAAITKMSSSKLNSPLPRGIDECQNSICIAQWR